MKRQIKKNSPAFVHVLIDPRILSLARSRSNTMTAIRQVAMGGSYKRGTVSGRRNSVSDRDAEGVRHDKNWRR
jgi:hypothetical protein